MEHGRFNVVQTDEEYQDMKLNPTSDMISWESSRTAHALGISLGIYAVTMDNAVGKWALKGAISGEGRRGMEVAARASCLEMRWCFIRQLSVGFPFADRVMDRGEGVYACMPYAMYAVLCTWRYRRRLNAGRDWICQLICAFRG